MMGKYFSGVNVVIARYHWIVSLLCLLCRSVPFMERVNTVLSWIDKPADTRLANYLSHFVTDELVHTHTHTHTHAHTDLSLWPYISINRITLVICMDLIQQGYVTTSTIDTKKQQTTPNRPHPTDHTLYVHCTLPSLYGRFS